MSGGPWDGLILLAIIAIPVAAIFFWMRRPFGGAPRDSLAMKGKAEMKEAVHVIPTGAGQDLVADAADLHGHGNDAGDAVADQGRALGPTGRVRPK